MPNYELTVILPAKLTEIKQKGVLEKVKEAVSEAKGKVEKENKGGKKELAYPIKKEDQGVYFFLELSLPADKVGPISRLIETDEQVLRHLLVRSQ